MHKHHVYTISRGYHSAKVWSGDRETGLRSSVSTLKLRPEARLTRAQRYVEITDWLVKHFPLPRPPYHATGHPGRRHVP